MKKFLRIIFRIIQILPLIIPIYLIFAQIIDKNALGAAIVVAIFAPIIMVSLILSVIAIIVSIVLLVKDIKALKQQKSDQNVSSELKEGEKEANENGPQNIKKKNKRPHFIARIVLDVVLLVLEVVLGAYLAWIMFSV